MDNFYINKRVNPKGLKKDEYDVIIIGAGIGGLTCGCYLAKAGLKVLIVEKNDKPGGYCTSFTRSGFTFDGGIHALEGCGPDRILGKIFADLGLNSKLKITRTDPSDILLTPFGKFYIRNNIEVTINELQKRFPDCKNEIDSFFKLVLEKDISSKYLDCRNKTFADLIKEYLSDKNLRTIFSILLMNVGLSPNKLAAINGLIFFAQYLSDGGYYPQGGMQAVADAFFEKFQALGGKGLLNNKVKKILTKDRKVLGVADEKGNVFDSPCVVANCDITQTYFNLVDDEEIKSKHQGKLSKMITSSSVFIVFLGLAKDFFSQELNCGALWYLDKEDETAGLERIFSGETNYNNTCVMFAFPSFHDKQLAPTDKSSIYVMCNANFKDLEYWKSNREKFADNLIDISEKVIPGIKEQIQVKNIATPHTLYKYTLNKNGAIHGWAPLLSQIDSNIIQASTDINGLYLTGHWLTHPGQGGIPMVAYSAFRLAKYIKKYVVK